MEIEARRIRVVRLLDGEQVEVASEGVVSVGVIDDLNAYLGAYACDPTVKAEHFTWARGQQRWVSIEGEFIFFDRVRFAQVMLGVKPSIKYGEHKWGAFA